MQEEEREREERVQCWMLSFVSGGMEALVSCLEAKAAAGRSVKLLWLSKQWHDEEKEEKKKKKKKPSQQLLWCV